jgi:hypothetical protein
MERKIITLCGSTKFKSRFEQAMKDETRKGHIVLTVGWYGHCDSELMSDEEKEQLDKLHLDKIEMSDEVLVINPNGYIGESTRREIEFANNHMIPVVYLERSHERN